MFASILQATAVLVVTLSGPILYQSTRRRWKTVRLLLSLSALFMLDTICLHLPLIFGAEGMTWAWWAKITEILVFSILGRRLLKEEKLLRAPDGWRWLPICLLLAILAASMTWLLQGFGHGSAFNLEVLVYQASMPGLGEELIYRGIFLSLLDREFGKPVSFAGVNWGWGAVITTVLFYLAHALQYEGKLSVDWALLPDFFFFGFLLCWTRERFGSIWPCVLIHNVSNCLLKLVYVPS